MWKIAVAAVMLVGCGPVVAQTLSDCAKVGAAEERLACFDKLAAKPAAPPADPILVKARAAIARGLKDGPSARFDGIWKTPLAVCGMVNSKNSFGGFTGNLPFVYVIATNQAYVLERGGDLRELHDGLEAAEKYCSKK